jgi:hypothetical protein
LKINFSQWNLGGKLIFIAGCLAIVSLFMSWVDLGIVSASGFQQDGYLFLIFYIYPIYKLLKEKPMKKVLGLISSILAVIIGIIFMLSKSVDVFGTTVNGAGTGLYVFIIASIMLTVGIVKYDTNHVEIMKASEV